jgi:hypothetical protein
MLLNDFPGLGMAERQARNQQLLAGLQDSGIVDVVLQRDRPPQRRVFIDPGGDAAQSLERWLTLASTQVKASEAQVKTRGGGA